MPHAYLSDREIDRLPLPKGGEVIHRDLVTTGLGVRVTPTGTKTFIVETRVRATGKVRRESLGRARSEADPEGLTFAQAKRAAMKRLAELTDPEAAPPAPKAAEARRVFTLADVHAEYLRDGMDLKPRTREDYAMLMRRQLATLADRDIETLDYDEVRELARTLGKASTSRANAAMRLLRALLNYAAVDLKRPDGSPALAANPFPARLPRNSKRKVFTRPVRRTSVIRRDDLPRWWKAVHELRAERGSAQAEVARDYLLTLLFSGLRKNEAARLQAQDVDLRARTFVVPETKNSEPLRLPMSAPLLAIIERRLEGAAPYLFPNRKGTGPFAESTHWVDLVRKASGVPFMLHDLRRTFATIADGCDISGYSIKRLLNHKASDGGDVTGGYVVRSVERLRDPMERIAAAILEFVKP
jgi:integrase